MITLIKLGGSLITDKKIAKSFRQPVMQRIASEFKQVIEQTSATRKFIIGHGSGSFGHVEAKQYNTISGVSSEQDWLGFAKVGNVAGELSQLVTTEFVQAGLPVFRFQPSASIVSSGGIIQKMNTKLLINAMTNNLIPLIHGDVAFDELLGGTIVSTETIFSYLVTNLDVSRILLLGEVDGVLDLNNNLVPYITPQNFKDLKSILGSSSGTDVTGGMYQKVADMVRLVEQKPDLQIVIANGRNTGILTDLLCNNRQIGTQISNA